MDWSHRKFLWRPEPAKAKDWLAEPLLKAVKALVLPQRVRWNTFISSVLDQGGLGSCTANAVAQAFRGALIRLGVADPELTSRLFLYFFARAMIGFTQSDSGAHLRDLFDVARKLGLCPESAWPYSDDQFRFKLLPDSGAQRLAFDQVGGLGYFKIASTGAQRVLDVKTALAAGYLVVFGAQIAREFAEFGPGSKPLSPPSADAIFLGGHALTIAGYDDAASAFDVVNSWGPDYGVGGWCQFAYDYIANPCTNDFWFIERAPDFSEIPR